MEQDSLLFPVISKSKPNEFLNCHNLKETGIMDTATSSQNQQ
jgi:hypothetical protein